MVGDIVKFDNVSWWTFRRVYLNNKFSLIPIPKTLMFKTIKQAKKRIKRIANHTQPLTKQERDYIEQCYK